MEHAQNWSWAPDTGPRGNLREAVAVFDNEDDLQAAVDDLECHGFSNAAVSRPAALAEIEAVLHRPVTDVTELEDDKNVPRETYIDKDSRTNGLMVMVLVPVYVLLLAGVGLANGYGMAGWETAALTVCLGLVGMLGGVYFARRTAMRARARLASEKKLGGLLLWVRTGSRDQDHKAMEILRRHAGRDVHLHGPVSPRASG